MCSCTTTQKVDDYKMIESLIEASYNDIKEFAKKKPDGIVNKLKVSMLNKLFMKAREVLENEPSLEYLELIDDELLPQNSDVVLLLGQYISALNQFKKRYYYYDDRSREYRWDVED